MDGNMQLIIDSFTQIFPDKIFSDISLTFSKMLDISLTLSNSLTFPGFPDKWSPCSSLPEHIVIVSV